MGDASYPALEHVEPPDDAGSETLARFRFQVELTLQDCLSAIVADRVERVICEFHEDYIVYRTGEPRCLVSVKHLEASQPRWTVRALCSAGGVFHLFGRWRAASEDATCLLRTNTGLPEGQDKPGDLKKCCSREPGPELDEWAEKLTPIFNEKTPSSRRATVDEVARFLAVLRLEDGLPGRAHIRAHNIVHLMPEVLKHIGEPITAADEVYDLLVAEVDRACRTETDRPMLEMLADPRRLDAAATLAADIQAKTITRGRLLQAIARRHTASSTAVRVQHQPPGVAVRLSEKLRVGGFGPTAINHARNLRLHWEGHRQRWSPDLPVHDDRFEEAKAIVLGAAVTAESRARGPEASSQPYGLAMLNALRAELAAHDIVVPGSSPADTQLLLGCAFELTNDCVIWWSEIFDVDEASV